MENELQGTTRKMNILVLGNSGAGKTTLIKAISGQEIETSVGEGDTQKIKVYESNIWPLRCIDTKGFEYSRFAQMQTIRQVKKFTKEQVELSQSDEEKSIGIDAVWYCIEGTARRTFTYNIEMMNKAIRRWKNVPVFAVITKSYSKVDIEENIDAVAKAFAKGKSTNLQKIIPVVADAYPINEELVVEQMGIEELCNATLNCLEEAKKISEESVARMVLEQKRYTANALTAGATTAGIVVGAVPIPFTDSLILVPLETALTKGILKIYGVEISGDLVTSIVSSAAITNIAKATLSSLKAVPNVAASVLNAVVAGFFVAALGEAVIALAEGIYTGKIEKEKLDAVVEFVTDKLANNAVLGFVVKFFENNADKVKGKSAKEIVQMIEKSKKEK